MPRRPSILETTMRVRRLSLRVDAERPFPDTPAALRGTKSRIGFQPVSGHAGRFGECVSPWKIWLFRRGRTVDEKTGWKPILHCAPVCRVMSRGDPGPIRRFLDRWEYLSGWVVSHIR